MADVKLSLAHWLFALVFTTLPVAAPAARASPAEDLVQHVVTELSHIAAGVRAGRDSPEDEFRQLASENFAIATMADTALPGRFDKKLTAGERQSYHSAYLTYLAKVFVSEAHREADLQTVIVGSRQTGSSVLVTTRTTGRNLRRDGDWLVRGVPPRIVEVAVDGVKASSDQRRRFAPVLERGGIAALIAALKKGPAGFAAEGGGP